MAIPDLGNEVFSQVLEGIDRKLGAFGHQSVLGLTQHTLKDLRKRRVHKAFDALRELPPPVGASVDAATPPPATASDAPAPALPDGSDAPSVASSLANAASTAELATVAPLRIRGARTATTSHKTLKLPCGQCNVMLWV